MAIIEPRPKPQFGLHALFDVPTVPDSQGKRRVICPKRLASCLHVYRDQIGLVVLEKVGAMPGNGVVSMFRFGEACGTIRGVLGGLGIWEKASVLEAVPAVWKATLGLTHDKTKVMVHARKLVAEQAPLWSDSLSKAKHHNRAEALLLATFGVPYYFATRNEKLNAGKSSGTGKAGGGGINALF